MKENDSFEQMAPTQQQKEEPVIDFDDMKSEKKEISSKLDRIDFESFFVEYLYETKIKAYVDQLVFHATWLKFTKRKEIVKDANLRLYKGKQRSISHREELMKDFLDLFMASVKKTDITADVPGMTNFLEYSFKKLNDDDSYPNLAKLSDYLHIWPTTSNEVTRLYSNICKIFDIDTSTFGGKAIIHENINSFCEYAWFIQNTYFQFRKAELEHSLGDQKTVKPSNEILLK